jgi:antitoxin VapB
MAKGSVFENKKKQMVRLPIDAHFPQGVKQVNVRVIGADRVLSPVDKTWDSFFLSENKASEDFLNERAIQEQVDRESLDD